MLSVDYTNEGWNNQQNISFYLFMKIKRAVFTAGEGLFFFFSPSLCHLILFPLWKQQIYAWSWTGKNWTLLPAGILPWRAAGSDERFHPEQIREYSTMSLFAQGTLLGRQEQGLSWCAPTSLGQPVRWGGAWGKTVRFLPASSVPNVTKWDKRNLQSEPRGEDFFAMQLLCLVMFRSRTNTCVNSQILQQISTRCCSPVHNTLLSSLLASCYL